MKDRKFFFSAWSFIVATIITLCGLVGFFLSKESSVLIVTAGAGLVTTGLGVYGAVNVAQKNVVSKNYVKELDTEYNGK